MDPTSNGARAGKTPLARKPALPTGKFLTYRAQVCARSNEITGLSRLPDGDKGADHVRKIFYRMGFNDQEIGMHVLVGPTFGC